ncbi:MAG: galactose-1-phosphate uridylyltransferase [Solirubrobacterales bacterium]
MLITPGRAERPDQFGIEDWEPHGPEGCPFCERNETRTPPEIAADRPDGSAPDGSGWLTRTVPNLYPALVPAENFDSDDAAETEAGAFASTADPLLASSRSAEPDMFASRPAIGHHDVIINSPRHVTSIGQLEPAELEVVVAAWRRQMKARADSPYVQLILNEGPDSGASLEHSHAQIGASPFVPASVARERERFNSYRERTAGASLLGEVLREEIRRGDRLVAIDDEVALICPWASRFPYELRIIPRRPEARFEEGEGGAAMLHRAIRGLNELFGRQPQLNLWVKTAPRGVEHFHWHLDLVPRLEPSSSFEMATGVDINVITPEKAADGLREAMS